MKVSVIVATMKERLAMLPRMIECFEAQTYQDCECVICLDHAATDYMTQGAKLNEGVRIAAGDLIIKWDDDDEYGPEFIARAVREMERRLEFTSPEPPGGMSRPLLAWGRWLIRFTDEPPDAVHITDIPNMMAGGTLCVGRGFAEKVKFRNVNSGVPKLFIEDAERHGGRLSRIFDAPEQYTMIRHGGNTWKSFEPDYKRTVDEFLRAMPLYEGVFA